jgi:hypothetical protein
MAHAGVLRFQVYREPVLAQRLAADRPNGSNEREPRGSLKSLPFTDLPGDLDDVINLCRTREQKNRG